MIIIMLLVMPLHALGKVLVHGPCPSRAGVTFPTGTPSHSLTARSSAFPHLGVGNISRFVDVSLDVLPGTAVRGHSTTIICA